MPSRRGDEDDDSDDRPARRSRRGFRCPYCGTDEIPTTRSKISTAGWVVFVVLLIVCLPLCVIGLFIKEDFKECSECGLRVGG